MPLTKEPPPDAQIDEGEEITNPSPCPIACPQPWKRELGVEGLMEKLNPDGRKTLRTVAP